MIRLLSDVNTKKFFTFVNQIINFKIPSSSVLTFGFVKYCLDIVKYLSSEGRSILLQYSPFTAIAVLLA